MFQAAPIQIRKKSPWPEHLDVNQFINDGWTPLPFRQFVVKVNSRCNLACDYCYVYELEDQSWIDKPVLMDEKIVLKTATRIAEHAREHSLESVQIVLHGGEPLLGGLPYLQSVVNTFRSVLSAIKHEISMQTNGYLLNEKIARWCLESDVSIGISLDGDKSATDRHRVLRNGKSSHKRVVAAVELLSQDEFRPIFGGLLCVVDVENDPIEVYEYLTSFKPRGIQLILPYSNWEARPPRKGLGEEEETPYGDWMIRMFDCWFNSPDRETQVLLFTEIMDLLLGGSSQSESIGLSPVQFIVIDTDGSIEQVDSLKSAFSGAPDTGFNIKDHTLTEALHSVGVAVRQIGAKALCGKCLSCPVGSVCGGGCYPHRYDSSSGFLSPSVYCADLFALIKHIQKELYQAIENNKLIRNEDLSKWHQIVAKAELV